MVVETRSRVLAAVTLLLMVVPSPAQGGKNAGTASAPPTRTVRGLVLNPLGKPAVGVEVWAAIYPHLDKAVSKGRTDGMGMYVLPRIPHRGSVWVFSTAKNMSRSRTVARFVNGGRFGAAQLRLWHAASVRGTVYDEAGKPVAGAEVMGTKDFTWLAGRFQQSQQLTDAKGRFHLRHIPIGKYVIRVRAPGFRMIEHRGVNFDTANVRLVATRGEGVRVAVQMDGLTKAEAATVRVELSPMRDGSGFRVPASLHDLRLDPDGSLRVTDLVQANWTVTPRAPNHTFVPESVRLKIAKAPLKPGKAPYRARFKAVRDASMRIAGTLRTEKGMALAGERLRIWKLGGRRVETVTKKDGSFSVAAPLAKGEKCSLYLVDSEWVLSQEKSGRWINYRKMTRHEITAEPGKKIELVAIPATFVSGRVVDQNGQAVAFHWIELQQWSADRVPEWSQFSWTRSDRKGRFVFPGVHRIPNPIRVHAGGVKGAGISETFRLKTGRLGGVKVTVPPAGCIEGRVVDAKGKPLAGVVVRHDNWDLKTGAHRDGGANVLTDREGNYRFVGVPPGGHRVFLPRFEEGPRSDVFEVLSGKTVTRKLVVKD